MINDLLGKLVADKYRVETLIREGESGDLYAGRHEVLDKPVMIKILPSAYAVDDRWVKSFVSEARAASSVSHIGILNITDFGTDAKGISYAVYDPVDGQTLRDLMDSEPDGLDEKRAVTIAKQIAAAMSAAHGKNVVHGHLDPHTVYVQSSDDGVDTVKVYGFGSDPLKVSRDADPRYLSPEQASAFPVADARSDIYTLGVILFEMLAGVVPFDGKTTDEVVAKRENEPPPPLSAFRRDLHADIEPILLSAAAVDPDRRYSSMSAFAEDLDTLGTRIGVSPAAAAAAAGVGSSRKPWQTALIAFGGIVVLAAALIYATSVRKTDPTLDLQADAGSLPVQPIGPATGAQEESLAKLPAMTEAEIMATSQMEQPPGTLAGGDGFNAWANGGAPPPGAPVPNYVPPGGQVYTIDPNGGSQFMPQEGGVILVPVPANTTTAAPNPTPNPKAPAANTAVTQAPPSAGATPKPMATPPPKKPATQPKASPGAKPADKPDEQEQQ